MKRVNGNGQYKGDQKMNLIYWNKGNSYLSNSKPEIEAFMKIHKPHVLCISELNAKNKH